jgi:apolipoprotein N-acyltransferase
MGRGAVLKRKTKEDGQVPDLSAERVTEPLLAKSVAARDLVIPALASALLLWASFAPVGASWLAWLAPIGWLHAVERKEPLGRRGYFYLWLSGLLFWLLILQGVRLAFWALIFGWIAISCYLALYIPLFVAAARGMRFRWNWPLAIAAPVSWVGMEVARSHLFTGFASNLLGHTQAHVPLMIQIADQVGGYGVGFVILAGAVALRQLWLSGRAGRTAELTFPVGFAAILLIATTAYGWWSLAESDELVRGREPLLKVMLIQENTPSIFESNPERTKQAWVRYVDATREAARIHGAVDLVVWPESTFSAGVPWVKVALTQGQLPLKLSREQATAESIGYFNEKCSEEFRYKISSVLAAARDENLFSPPEQRDASRPYLLLGSDALEITSDRMDQYNSAILVGPDAAYIDRYDKMHLVMFGEYIPLGPLLKFLSDAFGLGTMSSGGAAKSFDVAGVKVSPNICFESMLPELVSWQVRWLRSEGNAPEVLINITNDSWFWGSSILDHHLACSIFCAVENRRPLLIAANTGLSGHVDGAGRVQQVSSRLEKAMLRVEPYADSRLGLVQIAGYPIAWLCCALSAGALLYPWLRQQKPAPRS